jgi:hypothetical protein
MREGAKLRINPDESRVVDRKRTSARGVELPIVGLCARGPKNQVARCVDRVAPALAEAQFNARQRERAPGCRLHCRGGSRKQFRALTEEVASY